ncbi:MAG: glycosyltransferase family 39 protein, partial [Phototrophicales bacterium]|nr:glycosyltransferase family 39 protein [Phototrophicales bacterium]
MTHKQPYLFLIPILLLAVFLRLYHMSQQSFWFDEAFAWQIVIQPDMFPRIAADTHPPLFYLLLRGWMSVMGDSELALRSLSAFISTLTVAVMFPLGREIAKKLGEGMIFIPVTAMLFFALNDADIFHAQEARNYALYNLLGASSIWLYLRWIRTQARPTWLLWSVCIALLVYTHYQGVFIPALIGLHALFFLRGKNRLWALGGLSLAGIALAPWMLLVTLPQAQNALEKGLPFAIPSNIETLLDLRHRFLGDMWVLVIGLIALGAWRFIQTKKIGMGVLVTGWVIIPFGVLFAGNFIAPLLTDRKLLLIIPALCLLMAIGVHQLERMGRGLVLVALVVYSLATVDFYHQRELWREIAASALDYAQPQDIFLAEAEVGQYPLKYYITRQMPPESAFYTFTFLGDPTMSPTLDWYTYYDLFLPDILANTAQNQTDSIATAWVVFWSNDTTVLDRLATAGYTRTWTQLTDHIGNQIATYRYDQFSA